ncbi:MAG: hypothetical protein V9G04_03705 [Nocardioides sp.]|jgi:hypothetical protein
MESGPIPYRLEHGPLRVITLHVRPPHVRESSATVGVDGMQHPIPWDIGSLRLEVPADRPVSLSIVGTGRYAGAATYVLEPDGPDELEYLGPAHPSQAGLIGVPGTMTRQGKGLQAGLLVALAIACLVFLGIMILFASWLI